MFYKITVVFNVDAADYDTAFNAVKHWAECEQDMAVFDPYHSILPEGTVSILPMNLQDDEDANG